MNKLIKNAAILTVITLVSGLLLGVVYEITKDPIAATQEAAKKAAWQEVFPEAEADDFVPAEVNEKSEEAAVESVPALATVDEVAEVDEQGYVVTVTDKEGYGGNIQITVGITEDGTVAGVSILSISETAGLGMRATEPEFYNQYKGIKTYKFYVSKDGGEGEPIDALSGATITSRAVTAAVNTALAYYAEEYGGGE